jgi:hypothetical protein
MAKAVLPFLFIGGALYGINQEQLEALYRNQWQKLVRLLSPVHLSTGMDNLSFF